jgi:D-alanine-D-alanine ligase
MTAHSLVPMAAQEAEIDFGELAWRVLETSFTRHSLMREARGGTLQ